MEVVTNENKENLESNLLFADLLLSLAMAFGQWGKTKKMWPSGFKKSRIYASICFDQKCVLMTHLLEMIKSKLTLHFLFEINIKIFLLIKKARSSLSSLLGSCFCLSLNLEGGKVSTPITDTAAIMKA